MGYYTQYDVKITPDSEEIREEIRGDYNMGYALCDDADSCKWYEHEADMRTLSARFPDALFELNGEGEESGDIWRKYFRNGKMQNCPAKITFDPFDETKLL